MFFNNKKTPEFYIQVPNFLDFFYLLGDLIETILTLYQIAGLVPGREADRTSGHIIQVSNSPVIVIQVTACDSEYHTVEVTPILRSICLNKVQEDG